MESPKTPFDLQLIPPREAYRLLVSVVVPRPIAWVTSVDEAGRVNAAPYSFFNAMGSDPPLLALNIGNRDEDTPKDTALNIRQGGEFVVNIVSHELGEAMNLSAVDFPPDWSEIEIAQLQLAPSVKVSVPRLAASPVNLECREVMTLAIGRNRIVLGEVLHAHVRADLVDERGYIRSQDLDAIGRLGGLGWYSSTRDHFQIERLNFEQWRERKD